jgi:hypothetical protein
MGSVAGSRTGGPGGGVRKELAEKRVRGGFRRGAQCSLKAFPLGTVPRRCFPGLASTAGNRAFGLTRAESGSRIPRPCPAEVSSSRQEGKG